VATVMHCNLRPPDVSLVVMSVNYKARVMHEATNLTILLTPVMQYVPPSCTKFKQNTKIGG